MGLSRACTVHSGSTALVMTSLIMDGLNPREPRNTTKTKVRWMRMTGRESLDEEVILLHVGSSFMACSDVDVESRGISKPLK